MLASSSKTMLGRLTSRQWVKTYATASTSTSTVTEPPSSSLPGASPLPAAYRAPATSESSPSSSSSSSAPSTSFRAQPRVYSGFGVGRRPVHFYKLHVFATRNNTILTLTTTPGSNSNSNSTRYDSSSSSSSSTSSSSSVHDPHHAVAWVSAGSAGYKGASRGTYDAAVEVSLQMFRKIKELVEPTIGAGGQRKKLTWAPPTDLEIVWKGFGQGRDAVFRTLMSGEGDGIRGLVKQVTDAVSPFSVV